MDDPRRTSDGPGHPCGIRTASCSLSYFPYSIFVRVRKLNDIANWEVASAFLAFARTVCLP